MTAKPVAVALHDSTTDKYTAFVVDFPGLIVQGNTLADVDDKLRKLTDSFQKRISDMNNNLVLEPITI